MNDFPSLELVALPLAGSSTLSRGRRWPLAPRLVIGRASGNDVTVSSPAISPRHVQLEFRHARWWAQDLGSENGTLHNGDFLNDAELVDGDVLELPDGHCFVVHLDEERDVSNSALENAVLAQPDDDALWNVWADWLLEQGAPLGARLRGQLPSSTPPSQAMLPAPRVDGEEPLVRPALGSLSGSGDARFLRTMARRFRTGWIDVEWARGLPRRAVIRAPGPFRLANETPGALVERLFEEPAFRFLRALEIDPLSFGSGARVAEEVDGLLEVLSRVTAPPALEAVRIGPMPELEPSAAHREAWTRVLKQSPRLATPIERLFFSSGNASLEVVSAPKEVQVHPKPRSTVGLVLGEPNFIGQLDECAVQLSADDDHEASRLALRIDRDNGRWFIEDVAGRAGIRGAQLKVNGRNTRLAHLRDGDVLEPCGGFTLRFRLR